MKDGDHLIAPNWNDPGTSELLSKSILLDVQTLGYEWLRKKKDLRPMIVVKTTISHRAGLAARFCCAESALASKRISRAKPPAKSSAHGNIAL